MNIKKLKYLIMGTFLVKYVHNNASGPYVLNYLLTNLRLSYFLNLRFLISLRKSVGLIYINFSTQLGDVADD